jgi:hypothetical protein
VVNPVVLDGVAERANDVLLADDLVEALRAVATVKGGFGQRLMRRLRRLTCLTRR